MPTKKKTTARKPRKKPPAYKSMEEQLLALQENLEVDLVEVLWEDALQNSAWTGLDMLPEIAHNPPMIRTVGIELLHLPECVLLAESYGGGQLAGIMRIPTGMIRQRVVLAKRKILGD